jgi:hypothetical protein
MHHCPRSCSSTKGIALAVAFVAACSSASTGVTGDGALAIGTWGGDSAGMIVADTAMHLHIGCTFGDVSGPVNVSDDGTFDVAGSYTLHAYPIAVGPTDPARFTGRVNGTVATVTATIEDTANQQIVVRGPVVVALGASPQLGPCPICARPAIAKSFGARIEARVSGAWRAVMRRL